MYHKYCFPANWFASILLYASFHMILLSETENENLECHSLFHPSYKSKCQLLKTIARVKHDLAATQQPSFILHSRLHHHSGYSINLVTVTVLQTFCLISANVSLMDSSICLTYLLPFLPTLPTNSEGFISFPSSDEKKEVFLTQKVCSVLSSPGSFGTLWGDW